MAKGKAKALGTWDRCVVDLQTRRTRFRMTRQNDSPVIYIREYERGRRVRQFSSAHYRHTDDLQIETCYQLCIRCSETGRWEADLGGNVPTDDLTWPQFAARVEANLRARIARTGSNKNCLGHLKEIAKLNGKPCAIALERWAMMRDPIEQPGAFRNRLETLSHIQKAITSHGLDLTATVAKLKAQRPTGAAKKELEYSSEKPKAIPQDDPLQEWLDNIDEPEVQWLLAMIATYGLRPSEAWHAELIDEKGWVTIPGDGKTKTKLHYAPPVPSKWVKRYHLRENFEEMQKRINARWKIKWEERNGKLIPVNNSEVSNRLYKHMSRGNVIPLMARAEGREGLDWVRPYDLRHSYAVRCFTHEEVNLLPVEDFARWMGHGVDVHERVYLKWMDQTREKAALQQRHDQRLKENKANQPKVEKSQDLPPDIQARLAKLEQLEALLKA